MTPAARISAAIEILDAVLTGAPAERQLTNWARANRYAGSGDRARVRDLVFDVLRCRRSCAWAGGAETGRGLMLGLLRLRGEDLDGYFTGERFAPDPLTEDERSEPSLDQAPDPVQFDVPDWLFPLMQAAHGDRTPDILRELQSRAPVFLRVNTRKGTPAQAIAELENADVTAIPHPLAKTALLVTENARRVGNSPAYLGGLVELQDVASQAIVLDLPLQPGMQVLDYCAGGGGKALAIAAACEDLVITAHDTAPQRMRDIPARAERAGVNIAIQPDKSELSGKLFDLVFCDVPCSGSGAWRRAPEGKWNLTPKRLAELVEIQSGILDEAGQLVKAGGYLAYATCSLLSVENATQIDRFLARSSNFREIFRRSLTPLDGGDGFFIAVLQKSDSQSGVAEQD